MLPLPKKKYKIVSIDPKHAVSRSRFDMVMSSVADFFRKKRRLKIASAAFVLAVVLTATIYHSQLCYAVFINGETVGTVESMAQVSEVVNSVEKQASEILGYDYSLNDQITVSAEVGSPVTSPDSMGTTLLGNVNGITEAYIVHVGDAEIGAVEDRDAFSQLLSGYLDEYRTEDTSMIGFTQSVYTVPGFVSEESLLSTEEIDAMLRPDGGGEYALSVTTTEITQCAGDIPYETVYYDDNSMYEGNSLTTTEGLDGKGIITTSATMINGVLEGEPSVDIVVIKEAQNEYIAQGTAERPRYASTGDYIWPAEGVLTSFFGYRSWDFHNGLDIAGYYGQDIHAADGGTVIFAEWYSTYGNIIKIQHDNGDVTFYAHLSSMLVSVGDKVAQGDVIGEMGSTGYATGVHLHFEIRKCGEPVDPLNYLP